MFALVVLLAALLHNTQGHDGMKFNPVADINESRVSMLSVTWSCVDTGARWVCTGGAATGAAASR
jgi:hypothetical protein